MSWVLLSFLILLPAGAPESAGSDEPQRRIRELRIVRQNVFSDGEADELALYRVANQYHSTTREYVIRTQMLVREGDLVDEELLEQSERELRKLDFLETASVRVEPVDDEFADVIVETKDQWSLLPGFLIEGGGGLAEAGVTIEEANLLGHGKSLWAQIINESDVGTSLTVGYDDPQLLKTRWMFSTGFTTGPLVQLGVVAAALPFYSLDSTWSYGVDAEVLDEDARFFEEGEEVSRFREESVGVGGFVSRRWGSRFKWWTVTMELGYENREFSEIEDMTTEPLPDDELIYNTTISLLKENISYVKDTRIDKIERVEDIELGRNTSISLGRAGFPVSNGIKRWEIDVWGSQSFRFGNKRQYLDLGERYSSLETKDTILALAGQYYNKLKHQTLAFNVEFSHGQDLEEGTQFILGGGSGLRGYGAREFTGDKSFLTNAETRIFTEAEILTVAIGAVVFLDAGNVWDEDESIDFTELHYSTGVGTRLAFTKVPGEPILRVDLGWTLEGDGIGISFGMEQHF
jgi:outer membrane protein assembly factor BamA